MTRSRTDLRSGWTTGSCAAAAAKAATACLVTGQPQREIEIGLPAGARVRFPVPRCCLLLPDLCAEATVIKDAGDDPDVTNGASIVATVSWIAVPEVAIDGGRGVGTVTLAGLGLPVGQAAINPVPRAMITNAIREVTDRGIRAVISVPDGERLARRTLNARLGVLGGLSILGTTGIVRPLSTDAWRVSAERAVRVAAASGCDALALCTGGRTMRAAMALRQDLPPQAFVEVGDFAGAALLVAAQNGIQRILLFAMIGKLTKLAAGFPMTHADRCRLDTGVLAGITRAAGGDVDLITTVAEASTARRVYELWQRAGFGPTCTAVLCRLVADTLLGFVGGYALPAEIEVRMIDHSGRNIATAQSRAATWPQDAQRSPTAAPFEGTSQ